MALTPFRWISLALMGCMLAIIALTSIADKQPQYRRQDRYNAGDTTAARLRDVSSRLSQETSTLAARYRVLLVMDSVKRVAARLPDTGTYRVFISDSYDADLRSVMEKVTRDARSGRSGNAGRVDVFVINDTSRSVRGVSRMLSTTEVRYEMPTVPGTRCHVYVRTGTNRAFIRRVLMYEITSQQLLGPCAYFAAFGEPGPLVRQWMDSVGWLYSLEGSWTVAPVIADRRDDDDGIFKGPSPAIGALNVLAGGSQCIKGDLDVCERAIGMTTPFTSRARMRLAGGTYSQALGYRRFSNAGLGMLAGEFLADATRELGRDRFKAFWTSPDSVNVAFQKVTGQRWGAFVRQWMISRYGAIDAGPRLSGFAIGVSTLLVIVALVATMRISQTRQYV
jgi:hypothetical protein